MGTETAVVLYLDAGTEEYFYKLSDQIACAVGGGFMQENHIPPHIAVSIFTSEKEVAVGELFKTYIQDFKPRPITFSGLGAFLPQVLYAAPVMDDFLRSCNLDVVRIARGAGLEPLSLYVFGSWVPHLALASGLDEKALEIAFSIVAREFVLMNGFVERIGLTHCCPYEDIPLA